jgi:hypothetical protein
MQSSVKLRFKMTFKLIPRKLRFFSVLLHMDMNRNILHIQKHTVLHSWTLYVSHGSTTHQDVEMLPSFTHLMYVFYNMFKIFNSPSPMAQQPLVGQGFLITVASRSHSDTPHSRRTPLTSDRPDAKTSTWQHTTLTTDIHAPAGFELTIPAS